MIRGDTGEKGDKGPAGQGIDGPDGDQGPQGKPVQIMPWVVTKVKAKDSSACLIRGFRISFLQTNKHLLGSLKEYLAYLLKQLF